MMRLRRVRPERQHPLRHRTAALLFEINAVIFNRFVDIENADLF